MSTPFVGQIAAFSFGLVPKGWAACNGQLLPVNQNQALFSLLGTMYGGNGQTTFALPNLQGQSIVSAGTGFNQGQAGGEVNHAMTLNETPSHTHSWMGSSANAPSPAINPINNSLPGVVGSTPGDIYGTSPNTTLGSGSSPAGAGQPHTNVQPFLAISYCIALVGIFPSRN